MKSSKLTSRFCLLRTISAVGVRGRYAEEAAKLKIQRSRETEDPVQVDRRNICVVHDQE